VCFSNGFTIADVDYNPTRGGDSRTRSGSHSLSESSVEKDRSFSNRVLKWTQKMSSIACGSTGQLQNVDPREFKNVMEKPQPEKPPRKTRQANSHSSQYSAHSRTSATYPTKPLKSGSRDDYDHDHHTFATATTASATISYSADENNSDVSEAGMEVVMSSKDSEMEDVSPAEEYKTHSFPAGKHTFTIDTRLSMIKVVGSGAYGVVISSHDSRINKDVAVKMVPKAFNDEIDAKRILREIKLLKHLRHENIVGVVDMMPPTARYLEDYHDVYIVTDLMETDLHRIIYSKQKLSIDHSQYFIYQLLRGLKYIHSAGVIHRDLKPSNLLVNSNCDLKICDFGLARGIHDDHAEGKGGTMLLTEYVVTRWYRAPEIMLACHEYSKPIDIWSVGCIFGELIQRKPYFPGDDYIDQVCSIGILFVYLLPQSNSNLAPLSVLQLTIITEKLGNLPESELDFVTSEKARRFMRKLPTKTPTPLTTQFPNTPVEALDLMRKMLSIHPRKRMTVEDALAHPFLNQLHNPEDEPVADAPFDFSFEKEKLVRLRLQELIWREAGDFRPSCLPVAPSRDAAHRRKNP
jgi:mitogen-activated protein kinase 1/3